MGTCRSCNRRITWLKTPGGKAMPVDEDPVPEGNVVVIGQMAKVCKNAAAAEKACPGEPRYMPHWATCPDGPKWRRP